MEARLRDAISFAAGRRAAHPAVSATALVAVATGATVDRTRRSAITVQQMDRIQVRSPAGCPPTDVVVNQTSEIAIGDAVQSLLDLSRDVVADTIASAVTAVIHTQGWTPAPFHCGKAPGSDGFELGAASRAAIATAVTGAADTLVQQDTQVHPSATGRMYPFRPSVWPDRSLRDGANLWTDPHQ